MQSSKRTRTGGKALVSSSPAHGPINAPGRRYYIGLDPGVQGGMAILWEHEQGHPDSLRVATSGFATMTLGDVWRALKSVQDQPDSQVFAMLEEVGGYIGNELTARGSHMFEFGRSFGHLEALLTAGDIRNDTVPPQTWQSKLRIPPRRAGTKARKIRRGTRFVVHAAVPRETKSEWKGRLKAEAQNRFPHVKVTLQTADALLIGQYAYLLREGMLE